MRATGFSFNSAASESKAVLSFETLQRNVTFLLALLAFFSLAATREIQPVVGATFLIALLFGYRLRRPFSWWRAWMANLLILTVVALLLLIGYRHAFRFVLDLWLFLILLKCYTLSKAKDYLHAQIICFFILLSASVITVAFYFMFFFIGYVVLATLGLVLYSIGREKEKVSGEIETSSPAALRRTIRFGASVSVLILILIVASFLLIPHLSVTQLNAPLSGRDVPPESLTGFAEEIEFGEFKQLTPDQTVVMRVELGWPEGHKEHRPSNLRLRGLALEQYDEARWKRSPLRREPAIVEWPQLDPKIESRQRGQNINLTIYQNPDVTARVFVASLPLAVDFHRELRVRFDYETTGIQVIAMGRNREGAYTNPFTYTVTSHLVEEATPMLPDLIRAETRRREERAAILELEGDREAQAAKLAKFRKQNAEIEDAWLTQGKPLTLQAEEKLINLELPPTPLTEKIRDLAERVAPGPTKPEMVLQLIRFFHSGFRYALAPETPRGVHPIEAFLFRTKKGHCEYFATALALMLRSQGIPARIINGFYTTDWNNMAGTYVVRQSDAHAWTEVWLDGPGWLTIDPSPADSAGRAAYGLTKTTMLENVSEYLRIQWQRYVIDYSSHKQITLLKSARNLPGIKSAAALMDSLRKRLESYSTKGKQSDPSNPSDSKRSPAGWSALAWIISAPLIAAWLIYRRRKNMARRLLRTGVDYFDAFLRKLEKSGWQRPAGQTPAEWTRDLAQSGWIGSGLDWLVALYYRQKYAGETATADERLQAMRIVHDLHPPAKLRQA